MRSTSFACTIALIVFTCLATLLTSISTRAQYHDVTAFGARGDGTTDNTSFIQKAIDTCAVNGGKVYFPPGRFLTGTIRLKSNVILSISAGATLLAHTDIAKYPYLDAGIPFYGDQWAKQSLIFCKGQQNVGIEGEGTIDGQGGSFRVTTLVKPDRYKNRPYLLWFAGCKNVSVINVHLRNSAFWMQHYLGCEYVRIDGLNIWNHSNKNNDMMDIDGCRFVTISNINGDSDDDGITIKSTSPLISENITITNCVISSHCNALKFGTESTGGFRNVAVSNCVIKPSGQVSTIYGKPAGISGLALEIVDGGIMENITISNIIIQGPQVPIFIRLGNRGRKYRDDAILPPTGRIRNIHISDIVATGADTTGCAIAGIDGAPIESVSLNHISIETTGGGTVKDRERHPEAKEKDYPEATMFGKLPAYGFYVSNARDIRMTNVTVRSRSPDSRPGIALEKTENFSLSGLDIPPSDSTDAVVYITNSRNGSVSDVIKHYPLRRFVWKDKKSVNIHE